MHAGSVLLTARGYHKKGVLPSAVEASAVEAPGEPCIWGWILHGWGLGLTWIGVAWCGAQVVLVSATLPQEVLDMTHKFMASPLRVLVKRDELTLEVRDDLARSIAPPALALGRIL